MKAPNPILHDRNKISISKDVFFAEVIARINAIGILNWKPEVYRKDINRMYSNGRTVSDAVSSIVLRS